MSRLVPSARALELFCDIVDLPREQQEAVLDEIRLTNGALCAMVEMLLENDHLPPAKPIALIDAAKMISSQVQPTGPLPDPLVGAILGDYKVVKLLDSGGMGRVYLAETQGFDRQVAIKVLPSSLSAALQEELQKQFGIEKANLAKINHAGVAQLFHAGSTTDGTAYFVMEYVDGKHITRYCVEDKLDLSARLRLFLEVCRVLRASHNKGIVHRDLKPSNIMVNQEVQVKLLDFGISQSLKTGRALKSKARTLAYAPPEHLKSDPDIRGDVYSLGVLFAELVAGNLPFGSWKDEAELEAIIQSGRLKAPSEFARTKQGPYADSAKISAWTWRDLDAIFRRATAVDIEGRYAGVDALIQDIEAYLAGRPLPGVRQSFATISRKFARRNWKAVLSAAIMIAALTDGTVYYTVRLSRERDRARLEAAHSLRIETFLERVFTGGGGDAGPAKDLKVVTLLQQAVKSADNLNNDPATQADFLHMLGSQYEALGLFDEADRLLSRALKERELFFGMDSPQRAKTLAEMSNLRSFQGRMDEAQMAAEEAVRIDHQRLGDDDVETLRTQMALARVLTERGYSQKAVPILESVIHYETGRPAAEADLSEAENDLSVAEYNLGQLDEAAVANQRSLDLDRAMFGPRHPDVADHLMTMASMDEDRGHFDLAVAHAREALSIDTDYFGSDHMEVASAETALAQALTRDQHWLEALPYFRHALLVQRGRSDQKPTRAIGQVLNDLGMAEQHAGDLKQADRDLTETLKMYMELLPETDEVIGIARRNLATVKIEEGKDAEAESLLREDIALHPEAASGSERKTLTEALLGIALRDHKRYAEAEPLLLEAAGYAKTSTPLARQSLPGIYDALARLYSATGNNQKADQYKVLSNAPTP